MSVSESQAAVDLDSILSKLNHGEERLPRKAMLAARENREAIIPRLIQVLEEAAESLKRGEMPEGDAPFMALILLTEFRAREALPALHKALSAESVRHNLFGDLASDRFAEVLLTLGSDSPEVLDEFVLDDNLDEYTRASAANGFTLLVRDEVIPREQGIEHLRAALRHSGHAGSPELAAFIVYELIALRALEALPDIEDAYRQGFVDEGIIGDLSAVRIRISDPKPDRIKTRSRHIDDAIAELETWNSFKEPERHERAGTMPSQQEAVDLDAILNDLDHGEERLPRKAIQAARENREAIIPRLIQVIEEATRDWRPFETPDGNGPFFALLLLAEFRAREALPVYRAALASGEEAGYDLFGDAVYEFGGQILLSLGDDRIEVLNEFLHDERISPGVRGEVLTGFVLLARDGVIPWNEAVDHLRAGLRFAVEKQDPELAAFVICKFLEIRAVDALEDIQAAYEADAVDESIVGHLGYVEKELSAGDTWIPEGLRHVQDVVGLVEDWDGFQDRDDEDDWDDLDEPESTWDFADVDPDDGNPVSPWLADSTVLPIKRDFEHVGRNDPCPCGSGKKFKKCCYRRSEGDMT